MKAPFSISILNESAEIRRKTFQTFDRKSVSKDAAAILDFVSAYDFKIFKRISTIFFFKLHAYGSLYEFRTDLICQATLKFDNIQYIYQAFGFPW